VAFQADPDKTPVVAAKAQRMRRKNSTKRLDSKRRGGLLILDDHAAGAN